MKRPIRSSDGILTLGFGREQPCLAEGYASSASPYWAFKAFLPLALPESHPFWACSEGAMPSMPPVQRQSGYGFITRPQGGRDVVMLADSASRRDWLRHNEAKYHKFAYSARMAFSISLGSTSIALVAPDSMLALSRDGSHWRLRQCSEEFAFEDDGLRAVWNPWDDVSVETRLVPEPDGSGHRREHRIVSALPLCSFEGGFCVPRDPAKPVQQTAVQGGASVAANGFISRIEELHGRRAGRVIEPEPGSHLLWPLTWLPGLECELPAGESLLGCRVAGASSA